MKRYNGEYCHLLGAISDKHNFAIAVQIMQKGPLTYKELEESLPFLKKRMKHHIKRLVDCRFVFSKKHRNKTKYYLNRSTVLGIIKVVGRHIKRHGSGYKRISK